MKQLSFILLFSLLFSGSIFAQSDSLTYKNGFWLDGRKLTRVTVKEMMNKNEAALKDFNAGRTMEVVGYIVAYPSAFVLGYDLGRRLAGGAGSNTMLIAGGIGTAVGLVFAIVADNNYKNAVRLYNASLKKGVSALSFGLTESGGVGFVYRF